jgi:protein TonB
MLAVALFALTLGQTAPEAAERPVPRWSVRPRVEPSRLARSGLESATATIRCRARPDGRVDECRVIAENPSGSGLGQQLVAAARDARIDPASVEPGEDRWVSFSARFSLN